MTVPTKSMLLPGSLAESSGFGYIHVTADGKFLHEPRRSGFDSAEIIRETTDRLLSAYVTPGKTIPRYSSHSGKFCLPETTPMKVKVNHTIWILK